MKNTEEITIVYPVNAKILASILASKRIPAGAKLVLLALRNRLGGKNYTWPSQKLISEDTGLSTRQIRTHLRMFKKLGIISWKRGQTVVIKDIEYHLPGNMYFLNPILQEYRIKKNK